MVNLLSAPYRDRQFITIIEAGSAAVAPVEIRLGDYIGVKEQMERVTDQLRHPKTFLTKAYWTDTKNWGILGYAADKLMSGNAVSESSEVRHVHKVDAGEAERTLKFPPGHPLYDTVYAGHPLRPPEYLPVASFHPTLFQEKLNELMTLLASLSAVEVSIHYIRGYSEAFSASAGLDVPLQLPVEIGASLKRSTSNHARAALQAHFTPSGPPCLPDHQAWYEHEPTWVRVTEARLRSGLKDIEVELHYDDDFGVSPDFALKLSGYGFKLGGEFHKQEETAWGFHATFK